MSDDELQHARRRLDRVNLDALLAEVTRRAATIVRWAGDHRAAPFADARREMGHAVAQIGDVLRWLRRDRDALRTERDEALEVLVELVGRDCFVPSYKGEALDVLDSMASSSHAAALRLLARAGRVVLISEHGRRVIARWAEATE